MNRLFLILSLVVFSQGIVSCQVWWFPPPPSGGGSAYDPPGDISTMPIAWWRADDHDNDQDTTNNAGSPTTWYDVSGNENNISAASTEEPLYTLGAIGTKPAFDFVHTNKDRFYNNSGFDEMDGVDEGTIFIVYDRGTNTGTLYTFGIDYSGQSFAAYGYINYATNRHAIRWDGKEIYTTGGRDNPQVFSSVWRANATAAMWVTGTAGSTTTNITISSATHSAFCVGVWGSGASSSFWDGFIAEVIYFNVELSQSDIDDVELYLTDKYGL